MPRFEVEEVAIFYKPGDIDHRRECVITQVNAVSHRGTLRDYRILIQGSHSNNSLMGDGSYVCDENHLRKRKPPELGDWESLESNIGWERPVETA